METSKYHLIEHRTPNYTEGPTGVWGQTYATFEQATLAMFSRFYRSAQDIGAGRPYRSHYVSVQDSQCRTLARIITDNADNIRLQILDAKPSLFSIRSMLNEAEHGRNNQLYNGEASDVIIGRLDYWQRVNPFFDRVVSLLIRDTLKLETPPFPFVVQCLHPETTPAQYSKDTYQSEQASFTTPQAAWAYLALKVREISQDTTSQVNPYQQLVMLEQTGEGARELVTWSRGEDITAILKAAEAVQGLSRIIKSGQPDGHSCSLHFNSKAIDYLKNGILDPPTDSIHFIYFFPTVDAAIATMMAVDRESLQYQTAWAHRLPYSNERVWIENPSGRQVGEIGMKGQLQLLHTIPGFEDVYMAGTCFMGIDPSLTTKMQNLEAASRMQSTPWQIIGHIKYCECIQVHQFLFDQISFIGSLQKGNDHHRALNSGAYSLQPVYVNAEGTTQPSADPIAIDRLSDAIAFMQDLTDIPFQITSEGMRLDHLTLTENARNLELARAEYDPQGFTTQIAIHTDRLPPYAIDHFLAMDVPVKSVEKSSSLDQVATGKVKKSKQKRKPDSDGNSPGRTMR